MITQPADPPETSGAAEPTETVEPTETAESSGLIDVRRPRADPSEPPAAVDAEKDPDAIGELSTCASSAAQNSLDTANRLATLRPGELYVDDTVLEIRGVCRTGSGSFELFLQDGSRFYFDLMRDGSAIQDGRIFDPGSFEDIRQTAPLAQNRGELPRVRVADVGMRSDAGYTVDVAFLVSTAQRGWCGARRALAQAKHQLSTA